MPPRGREARCCSRVEPPDRFEWLPHFSLGADHGADSQAIYAAAHDLYLPLEEGLRRHFRITSWMLNRQQRS
jgi:hypothetical protein